MTVLGLGFLAFMVFVATVAVFVAPWFDVRDVDWERFAEGFAATREEQDQ